MFEKLNPFASSTEESPSEENIQSVLSPNPLLMPSPDVVDAPVSPAAISVAVEKSAQRDEDIDPDRLVEVVNQVQSWVENHDYPDGTGNSYLEGILDDINDEKSLRRPVMFRPAMLRAEVMFVLLYEGWEEIEAALDLSRPETLAARDAHQLYAETEGFANFSSGICLLSVYVDEDVAQWMQRESDVQPERTSLLPSAPDDVDVPEEPLTDSPGPQSGVGPSEDETVSEPVRAGQQNGESTLGIHPTGVANTPSDPGSAQSTTADTDSSVDEGEESSNGD